MHLSTGILEAALKEPLKPRLGRLEDGVAVYGAETLSPRQVARRGGYELDRSDLPAPLSGWNQVSDALLAEKRADDNARSDATRRDHPEERPAIPDR